MVKNPFLILLELVLGIAQRTWEEIIFVLSKLWEFLQALSYYSTQNLPLAIFSAVLASAVTYFTLKYVFKKIPFKLILIVIGALIVTFIALIVIGLLV
ncbi:MAG: hypothetical protein QXO57_00590 [Candidatus Aenigmatarchaeota archaeon]|nr:hypothetical protein [Candidatus Aenigmarchaeota archaeon]